MNNCRSVLLSSEEIIIPDLQGASRRVYDFLVECIWSPIVDYIVRRLSNLFVALIGCSYLVLWLALTLPEQLRPLRCICPQNCRSLPKSRLFLESPQNDPLLLPLGDILAEPLPASLTAHHSVRDVVVAGHHDAADRCPPPNFGLPERNYE